MNVYFIIEIKREFVVIVTIPKVVIKVAKLQNQSPVYSEKFGIAFEIDEKGRSNAK
jgi:hypothetical protein